MITQLSGGGSPTSNLAQGTAAARPSTPATGFYYATDTGELSMANASLTGWQTISKTSAATLMIGTGNTSANLQFGPGGPFIGRNDPELQSNNASLTNISTGQGFRSTENANSKQGTISAMTAGAVTVANTSVTASSRIFVMRGPGGTNPGAWTVSAITAGTSFAVASTNAADTGTGWFEIFEPG